MYEDNIDGLLGAGLALFIGWIAVCALAVAVLMIAGMWKTFEKAGKPGWAAIIPIYNVIVLLEIVGRPLWWILLFLIPLANIVFSFIVHIDVARSFGQGTGFGVGLTLLGWVFFPILGFGKSRYLGPAVQPPAVPLR